MYQNRIGNIELLLSGINEENRVVTNTFVKNRRREGLIDRLFQFN